MVDIFEHAQHGIESTRIMMCISLGGRPIPSLAVPGTHAFAFELMHHAMEGTGASPHVHPLLCVQGHRQRSSLIGM